MDLTRGKIICDDDDEPHCDSQTQKGEGSCKKARSDSPFEEEGIRKGSATRPNFLKVSFSLFHISTNYAMSIINHLHESFLLNALA